MAKTDRVTSASIRSECATGFFDPEGRTESQLATSGLPCIGGHFTEPYDKYTAVAGLWYAAAFYNHAFVETLALARRSLFRA